VSCWVVSVCINISIYECVYVFQVCVCVVWICIVLCVDACMCEHVCVCVYTRKIM